MNLGEYTARVRGLWRGLTRSHQLDADMDEEMRLHVQLHAERLMREHGLDSDEARRRAFVAFGGIEKYKEEGRDARGLQWIDAVSLDSRLGLRMLVKHRWLTIVGGFAMAVAIAIGATFFEMFSELLNPRLPFEDGGRVVSLQYASDHPGNPERRLLHDFFDWRRELRSFEHVGAFRNVQLNLVSGSAPPEPTRVAEISASAFALANTPPLLGRYLLPEDERESAPSVLVIGYRAWQSRFAGDPHVIGRGVNLGGVPHTVVGVMPDGFAFPVDHQYWTAMRLNPLDVERLQGPELFLFARLGRGVTIEEAQAELSTIGQRTAAEHPEKYQRLRPVALPFTREHLDLSNPALVWVVRIAQILVGALSFVVAVNLAILVYARTITRIGEIAMRTALGASRRRILAQLFIEAFVLSALGAGAGLVLADVALAQMQLLARRNGSIPFWLTFDLSPATIVYALALAILAAFIMGVLPGLKATGRRLTGNLNEVNSRTGARLGAVWTTLVVAQVAVAVAVLPVAAYVAQQVTRIEMIGPGFAAEQFIVGTLVLERGTDDVNPGEIRARQLPLIARLESEPGVSAVTFSSNVPGFSGGGRIEFESGAAPDEEDSIAEVSALSVALELFDTYDVELLAGRQFQSADVGRANAVVVNRTFAASLLPGRNPLGVRFRYLSSQPGEQWYQIVGVVRDFPSFPPAMSIDGEPTVYHAAAAGDIHPVVLSVRFAGRLPAGFADRFRELGAEVDPALQLRRVVPLSTFYDDVRSLWRYVAWGAGLLTLSVLLLSAAGIYALMSFTVAQRTREIGIRTALGAQPRRVLAGVFARAIRQLATGVFVGSLLSAAAFTAVGLNSADALAVLIGVAAVMTLIGVMATIGPARRGLRIQASEALRT